MTHDILVELDRLAKACRNTRDVTGDTLDIYLDDLADLPPDLVVQAIRECRRAETFFPAVAEIRRRVVAIAGASVLVDPESAWGEVMREVERVGAYRLPVWQNGEMHPAPEPAFSSPLIAEAVAAIGWTDICMTTTDQLGTLRAQFRDALRAIQNRKVDRLVSGRAVADAALASGSMDPMAAFGLPSGKGDA